MKSNIIKSTVATTNFNQFNPSAIDSDQQVKIKAGEDVIFEDVVVI